MQKQTQQNHIYVYRTNIIDEGQVQLLNEIYQRFQSIKRWTVDCDDVDKVLRIVSKESLPEEELILAAGHVGISCESLPD